MDSMVNHYTASKRLRHDDAYTPEGKFGQRPDYAVTVYAKILKEIYPDVPVGWSSTLCVMVVLFGLVLMVLGVIGEYLGKIILILNNTPQYIVRETINSDAAASEKVRTLIRAAAGEAAAETEEEPEKL